MAKRWTLEEVQSDIYQSEFGRQLVEPCADKIEVRAPKDDPRLRDDPDCKGYYDPETKGIVINASVSREQAITTIAHEAEHAKQDRNNELLGPTEFAKEDDYVKYSSNLEARAETSSNRVAVDLAELGQDGPLNAKLKTSNWRQTEEYKKSFVDKEYSHEKAAENSERLWQKGEHAPSYEREFRSEWRRENPNAVLIPEYQDRSTESQVGASSWRQEMEAKREAAKIKPPEPPADTQKPTHGLSM